MPAPVVDELPTSSKLAIGRVEGDPKTEKLLVGEYYSREHTWVDFDTQEPANFTGWVPEAYAVDANSAVVGTPFEVTPDPGDTTGKFRVTIPIATVEMRDNAVKWRFDVVSGAKRIALACAPLNVESCAS